LSIKAGKVIERASILAEQLKEISLFLIIIREQEAAMALRIGYIICRLVTPRIRNNTT
jgi:hypothetical protein